MMISDAGVAIRTQVNEISLIGRDTQGVRVMKLNGAQIATIAVAPHEDEEEIEYDEDGNPIVLASDGEENAVENQESDKALGDNQGESND